MHRIYSVVQVNWWLTIVSCAVVLLGETASACAQGSPMDAAAQGTTLEQIRQSRSLRLGYYTRARPFSFENPAGQAEGYSVDLCRRIADAVKSELGLANMALNWVPVAPTDRARAIQQGQVNLLCAADRPTLTGRQSVDFSIPVFPDGIGAVVRANAPARLRQILLGQPSSDPKWRASSGQLLQAQTFAVIAGSATQSWLAHKQEEFNLTAKVLPVGDYNTAIKALAAGKANVVFGDWAVLHDAVARSTDPDALTVLSRRFTREPVTLVLSRGDASFRLIVDGTLSRLYTSGDIKALYQKWFGAPSETVLEFFQWNSLAEWRETSQASQ